MTESNAVLAQRLTAAEARLKVLETADRQDVKDAGARHVEVLQRITRLEVRVGFIAVGASFMTTLAMLVIKATFGGG